MVFTHGRPSSDSSNFESFKILQTSFFRCLLSQAGRLLFWSDFWAVRLWYTILVSPESCFVNFGFTHVRKLKLSTILLPSNFLVVAVLESSDAKLVIFCCRSNSVWTDLAVSKSFSSLTSEFERPSMKSINVPVNFNAMKDAGRRIFIIMSIPRIWNISAIQGSIYYTVSTLN